ncbi:MAG: DNA polymerase III [Spirochaetes bacterium]|nr:MAG: DNA polymerase III [Spirochaetota bacterium]
MFENIIGQISTVSTIIKEIKNGTLPHSLLFYGPQFSGKLSAALETARSLSCEYKSAEWGCDCPSCVLNRSLLHPHVLMIGPRYFGTEIVASGEALKRVRRLGTRYLFIRAVRKLTRRFDPLIWEGIDNRATNAAPDIVNIENELDMLNPNIELPKDDALEKSIDSITKLSLKVEKKLATNNIAIQQIRNIALWTHMTSTKGSKIIILENADVMQEASSNSLLKLLEEPPDGTYIILITKKRNSLLPTILSRVRQYPFFMRTKEETDLIIEKIFYEKSGSYESLQEYFDSWKDVASLAFKKASQTFIENIFIEDNRWNDPLLEIDKKLNLFSSRENTKEFISVLIDTLHFVLTNQLIKKENNVLNLPEFFTVERINTLKNIASNSFTDFITLNLKPSLVLKNLLYSMREAVKV